MQSKPSAAPQTTGQRDAIATGMIKRLLLEGIVGRGKQLTRYVVDVVVNQQPDAILLVLVLGNLGGSKCLGHDGGDVCVCVCVSGSRFDDCRCMR